MTTSSMTTSTSVENPLRELAAFGQSIWLDYIRRDLITSGELNNWSNKTAWEASRPTPRFSKKPSPAAPTMRRALVELQKTRDLDAKAIYERLAIRDIQDAAECCAPVYERTAARRLCKPGSVSVPSQRDESDHRRSPAAYGRPSIART